MSWREVVMILGMAAVTFAVRYPVLLLVSRAPLTPRVRTALGFIPPAVLTAIIAPALFMPQGRLDLHYTNVHLLAGILAGLIAWRTGKILPTIVAGMTIFLLLKAVVP